MRLFTYTALGVGLAIALGAAGIAVYADPFNRPGEPWYEDSFLSGQDIHLLSSGRYANRSWCDVCEPEQHEGTWSESRGIIVLSPDHLPNQQLKLRRTVIHGCPALVPLRPDSRRKASWDSGAYYRHSNGCENQR
jgi:hypothetical protein